MGDAKKIVLRPIDSKIANQFIERVHYSGKLVLNSNLHIGVFYGGTLHGAMQFGSPLDKRKVLPLVNGTQWHQMMELNRMAFDDTLPRNSESRALAIAMKLLRKHAPQVKWILSFADATQCGDGTIYRASGFVLTAIKKNSELLQAPTGDIFHTVSLNARSSKMQIKRAKTIVRSLGIHISENGKASTKPYIDAGFKPLEGYQLRYIYFVDPTWRDRLAVPEIPYSQISEIGARMYKGVKLADGQ